MDQQEQKKPEPAMPAEAPKPTAPAEAPAASTPPQAPPKSGGSKTGLIIIIVIVVLVVLGVGGYFAVRYFTKKSVSNLFGLGAKSSATATATTTSGKVSVQSIIDALMYPGSKIADQKQEKDSSYVAELTLSSADGVAKIKSYYTDLIAKNGWKITRQGTSGDNNFYLTIEGSNFTAEIDTTKYDGYDTTDISIRISGENLTMGGITTSSTAVTTSKTAATSATTSSASGDYIISDSNARVISTAELTSLTPWKLKVARNEIYARHGRPFVHKDLQCYFDAKTWYGEDSNFSESSLSTTENKNIATILAYEQETSSPLLETDSGCNTNN